VKYAYVIIPLVIFGIIGVDFALRKPAPDKTYTNIYPGDYVGPESCGECHEDNYRLWKDHAHRRMNQNPSEETVLGDFSGRTLDYAGNHVVFHRDGEDFIISIYKEDRLFRRHKVTRTVGSLYLQYYMVTQIEGPEDRDHIAFKNESKLQYGYSFELDRWLPEIYFDSTLPAEHTYFANESRGRLAADAPPTHPWNTNCLICHNTYPYVARLWKQRGANDKSFTGYPEETMEWQGETFHQGGFSIRSQLRGLHADELVTIGISCESCHFGGREHAIEEKDIRFVPTSPDLKVLHPKTGAPVQSNRKDPFVVNSICSQCHIAGLQEYPNGAHAINSSEALSIRAGGCASQIKCTDCHNPHQTTPPSGALDLPEYVEACISCHESFKDSAIVAAHSRHPETVNCLDCHMPRIVAGLDTVTRSHFIGSPTDKAMIKSGMPNACNLCHLDQSTAWTITELEKGWGRKVFSDEEMARSNPAMFNVPLGDLWMNAKFRLARLVAIEAHVRSPFVEDPVPQLLNGLTDEFAFNRTFALIALQRHLGRKIPDEEFHLTGSPEERAQQVEQLRVGLAEKHVRAVRNVEN
jgi:predicted CXXCH cytochrome family protein